MAVVEPEPRPIEDDLKNENGQIVVSSRMVAERFGKEYKNVLRDIDSLIGSKLSLLNSYFMLSNYVDDRNRTQKEYLMTRDGFTFIFMGFTGKEADEFKLAYI